MREEVLGNFLEEVAALVNPGDHGLRGLAVFHCQCHHRLRDQPFLGMSLREYFGFANNQHSARAQDAPAATQPVGDGRAQKINLELDAHHVLIQTKRTARRAARSVVSHGGQHTRVNQTMLLPVTLGWNQDGFAIFILDPGELHTKVANEIGGVEDVSDSALREFIHVFADF